MDTIQYIVYWVQRSSVTKYWWKCGDSGREEKRAKCEHLNWTENKRLNCPTNQSDSIKKNAGKKTQWKTNSSHSPIQ